MIAHSCNPSITGRKTASSRLVWITETLSQKAKNNNTQSGIPSHGNSGGADCTPAGQEAVEGEYSVAMNKQRSFNPTLAAAIDASLEHSVLG